MPLVPPVDRSSIRFRHWSLKVARRGTDGTAPDVWGDIVTAVDDLDQSITNLILTPKGSVPTEPEKGVHWEGVIDKHPSIGIPMLTREIWDALAIWEPRIVVQRVEVQMPAYAHFVMPVFWRPIESVLDDLRRTEVTYGG